MLTVVSQEQVLSPRFRSASSCTVQVDHGVNERQILGSQMVDVARKLSLRVVGG